MVRGTGVRDNRGMAHHRCHVSGDHLRRGPRFDVITVFWFGLVVMLALASSLWPFFCGIETRSRPDSWVRLPSSVIRMDGWRLEDGKLVFRCRWYGDCRDVRRVGWEESMQLQVGEVRWCFYVFGYYPPQESAVGRC